MQQLGHLLINEEKYLVLMRERNSFSRSFKVRKVGIDGMFMPDESLFLEGEPKLLQKLLEGEVISL
jgi:hypothetical protein